MRHCAWWFSAELCAHANRPSGGSCAAPALLSRPPPLLYSKAARRASLGCCALSAAQRFCGYCPRTLLPRAPRRAAPERGTRCSAACPRLLPAERCESVGLVRLVEAEGCSLRGGFKMVWGHNGFPCLLIHKTVLSRGHVPCCCVLCFKLLFAVWACVSLALDERPMCATTSPAHTTQIAGKR